MERKDEIALMKAQLSDMMANRGKYEAALSSGVVVAGFGGDLNGTKIPETILKGRLPPGVTPAEASNQVVAFMKKTIEEAQAAHESRQPAFPQNGKKRIR